MPPAVQARLTSTTGAARTSPDRIDIVMCLASRRCADANVVTLANVNARPSPVLVGEIGLVGLGDVTCRRRVG